MSTVYVKPTMPGIVDPQRRDRLAEGVWRPVPMDGYWQRLAIKGEVLLCRARPDGNIEGEPAAMPVSPRAKSRRTA